MQYRYFYLLPILLFCITYCGHTWAQPSAVHYKDGHYHITDSIAEQGGNLPALLSILEWQHFTTSVHSRDVPKPVKQFYTDVTATPWHIADTGADYNCCCFIDEKLPDRQLIYLGYNSNVVLMSYMHGMGPGGAMMIAIFRLDKGRVTDFWASNVYSEEGSVNQKVIIQQLRQLVNDKELEGYILGL